MVVTIEFMLLLLSECLNTSIEALVDYVAKNKKFYLAKKSKDIASGAVSISPFNMGMVSYYSIETLKLLFSHQVNDVPEIPLVVDSLQVSKTKELLKILYALRCEDELATILETKKIRPGVGKTRNRKYKIIKGRFVIWTKDAFEKLNSIFRNRTNPGVEKKGYILERPMLTNANIARIINSDDIQSVVKPMEKNKIMNDKQKKNPLTNKVKMDF